MQAYLGVGSARLYATIAIPAALCGVHIKYGTSRIAVCNGTMSSPYLLAIAADIYTPLLGALYLRSLLQAEGTARIALRGALLLNLAVAWGWMFADYIWSIWPGWSLDYSTHTAVALAFIVCLCFSMPKQSAIWIASLVGYAALLVALDYHSAADIVATAFVAGTCMLPAGIWGHRESRPSYPSCRGNSFMKKNS